MLQPVIKSNHALCCCDGSGSCTVLDTSCSFSRQLVLGLTFVCRCVVWKGRLADVMSCVSAKACILGRWFGTDRCDNTACAPTVLLYNIALYVYVGHIRSAVAVAAAACHRSSHYPLVMQACSVQQRTGCMYATAVSGVLAGTLTGDMCCIWLLLNQSVSVCPKPSCTGCVAAGVADW